MRARLDDVDPFGDLQLARALQVGGVGANKLLSFNVTNRDSRHLRRKKRDEDEWDGWEEAK